MHINRSFFATACRATAFSFLMAATASLAHAQQASSAQPSLKPLLLASEAAPAALPASDSSSLSSSSSSSSAAPEESFDLKSSALDSWQPPPRRRYGRPNYADSHSNPDGSPKYVFMGGIGLGLPIGDTHLYDTPSYTIQLGGGRNFNKTVGVLLQFDYNHFGLQGSNITNQTNLYDTGCTSASVAAGTCGVSGLDGNSHIWSFTLNPTFTLPTEGSLGAYAVVGGGFYHKVTNFTEPTVEEVCYYYCEDVGVNANVDHYTSNAGGVNGGFGLTYKFSRFSNERFYMEARYVLMLNSQRHGVTAFTPTATTEAYTGSDFYPQNSNRTTYIPITFGLRF